MNPEVFVSQLRSVVVKQNLTLYRDLFETTTPEAASDAYWKRVLALHRSLGDSDRAVLLEIMGQVAVDSVSSILGILDGVSCLEGKREDFVLTSKSDNRKLNGKLQDLFLEAEEQGRQSP